MTATTKAAAAGDIVPGRPARPGGAAYWRLVERHANAAPPLTVEQQAVIRIAFGSVTTRTETAA
ncbi:hypothetical protein [Actinacidiphila sp. ITFR-21]|uniref:hypothetical protein n=1 Tax=Actinacidiphila sp. ITFR-21 TaxID=3075199 RepID=UPI002889E685|nr:hypothetical protein [Streptomyces sp. ITFR-21]WNI16943.1 hypothetical protein RLT57_16365 [Streptomyces sp. ITFR-21]